MACSSLNFVSDFNLHFQRLCHKKKGAEKINSPYITEKIFVIPEW